MSTFSNPSVNASMVNNVPQQSCLFDTGVSHHATSSATSLPSFSEYGGPDEVHLGDAIQTSTSIPFTPANRDVESHNNSVVPVSPVILQDNASSLGDRAHTSSRDHVQSASSSAESAESVSSIPQDRGMASTIMARDYFGYGRGLGQGLTQPWHRTPWLRRSLDYHDQGLPRPRLPWPRPTSAKEPWLRATLAIIADDCLGHHGQRLAED
nr:uncharacterized protein LOC109153513 [Ipomoea batatas]